MAGHCKVAETIRPGKHTKNSYGKITMLLMGKSTINGHFQ